MGKESSRQVRFARKIARHLLGGMAVGLMPLNVIAGDHDHHGVMHDHAVMDHSAHKKSFQDAVIRTTASYNVPDVTLTSFNGERIPLRKILSQGPVMVNFIYTSCTTVCPAMSATFSAVQERLATGNMPPVRMISISIDPEYDTPERLKAYAQRFRAGPQWQFLTGTVEESVAVQRAFDAYRGNKMNHAPVTLLRSEAESPWVRIDGFASASQLAAEANSLSITARAR